MNATFIGRGMLAGFIATLVLSAIMLMKQSMGVMSELDPIAIIARMAGASSPVIGWIGHFVIGTVLWGGGFAIVSPSVPGPFWFRGVIFAIGAWLMMMFVIMPMAGSGVFGLGLGIMAPVVTLILHVVFGLVLGGIFGLLGGKQLSSAHYSR